LLIIAERPWTGVSRRGIFWKQKLLQYDRLKIRTMIFPVYMAVSGWLH